jgi:large subunit ribosomal protein L3
LSIGLIGNKSGMTRLFLEDGESVPVTAVSVCGNFVADIKTASNDGYTSLVVSKTKKSNNINKSKSEFYKKVNLTPGIVVKNRQMTLLLVVT